MASEFRMVHRVEFAETDLAGIMHFANFFRLMERTEHAFFRSLGTSIHTNIDGASIGWPRVRATCEYRQPLRFEDEVEVQLLVREKKPRALTYDFIFRLAGQEVARGSMTAVCVSMDREAGRMRAVTIPASLAEQLEVSTSVGAAEVSEVSGVPDEGDVGSV